ncbi:2-C-methyl-D-erythritol 4-phosphate cytidylyltransferase [Evansella caseinilytica]|uniref:2-C-methyl-D-erythritol 4-phosphate cytidylyltransferase n=1 Tax=Evansella caseinilytica TaxID=1503961 RepID=A0A1H3UIW6_9BACI|nr:2-C-methyl-D-erythritol 4-phosphate cytidylyltransferase [Evansella caseinilytica]SDZ62314.1 2-C-methyl-D-erythritol 4-phosphate cytidylyltransferase [Evansella caseinilytica]
MEKYTVVIPAAGQGKRMNAGMNKQFICMDHIPLLIHTLRVFEEDLLCRSIVLVVNPDERNAVAELLQDYNIRKVGKLVRGGKERQQSVYEGLKAMEEGGIVLVHDGARPFIDHSIIHKLVRTAGTKGAATVATRVKDTIKQVEAGQVKATVDRSCLWAVQTPQAFRHTELLEAHRKAEIEGFEATDDASIIEFVGAPVYIVEGDYENIKITTPEDIVFGEAIISNRKEEQG